MIVIDSSVLIAFFDEASEHHEAAAVLLEVNDTLGASSLTLGELLVLPARTGRLDEVLTALRDLEIADLPPPRDAGVRLARLCAATGLAIRDCWVLLAAEDAGAAIASFDPRLIAVAAGSNQSVVELPDPAPITVRGADPKVSSRRRTVLRRNVQ